MLRVNKWAILRVSTIISHTVNVFGVHHLCLPLFRCSDGYMGDRCEVEIYATYPTPTPLPPIVAATTTRLESKSSGVGIAVGGSVGGVAVLVVVIIVIILILRNKK